MIEWFDSHLVYALILILFVIGLYGMFLKQNLLKKVIGMTIFQSAIILFFVAGAYIKGATVPIYLADAASSQEYMNPLPHTLMLTAIVVGVATVGLALSLLIVIYRRYGSLEEPEILKRMQ
ncbi:MAG: cation:proton antiporter subunit C [Bacteriovoracaceae bacterium]